jgi:predicted ATP-grasp superfamily ATP-dependent carboligase
MRVLVTNASYRNALAAIRALGGIEGIRVEAADRRRGSWVGRVPQGFVSRHCRGRHFYADPGCDPDLFAEEIEGIVKERKMDVLLPLSVATVLSCLRVEERLRREVAIPFGSLESVSNANDKGWLVRLARRIDVPTPRTAEVDGVEAARNLGFDLPVVLKACRGAASNAVWYIDRPEDWERASTDLALMRSVRTPAGTELFRDVDRLLVQDFVPGDVHDVCILAERGRLRALLTQRRAKTTYLRGGSGILNVTTRIPPLHEYAERLVEEIGYHGVAQIEFKQDARDGTFRLLEMNAKFWGTLALSIAAGINFPYLATRLALGQSIGDHFEYEVGLAYRWRFPGEFVAWLHERKQGRRLADLVRSPAKRTLTDWRWSDPLPSVHQVAMTVLKARGSRRGGGDRHV